MNDLERVFLKANVQAEPLFDQWYAWPHLIPPATAARNVTERHLKIMESYVAAPDVHAEMVRNPKMAGGPFIDLQGGKVDEIRALCEQTRRNRPQLLELSAAIQDLETMLRNEAKGFSLEPLYAKVPACLRGYVELVYDLNHNPSFRIIEPLLYRSRYYDRSAQSLMLSLIHNDDRPFVLSTPRLETPDAFHLRKPFDDETMDWLFRTKLSPQPWGEICERLEAGSTKQAALLRNFFTSEQAARYETYRGAGVRWRYFGHACILVESKDVSILFDPVLSYTYEAGISRYTYDDLPETIDYVIISHNHQDHILFETLMQIRHRVKTFVVPSSGGGSLQDPSVKLILQQMGCRNVIELRDMESLQFDQGSITALPFFGEHSDLNVQAKLAYLVRLGEHPMLFLADSCNVEPALYRHVHEAVGDVSAMFVGMECDGAPLSWLYGPLLTRKTPRDLDHSRRLAGSNYRQAVNLVDRFQCKECYVYAMGQEPWLNHVMNLKYTSASRPIVDSNMLIRECSRRGIHAERLYGEKEILIERQ